ncbi:MAG: ATP-binding protein [Eubacteriales bacterium]
MLSHLIRKERIPFFQSIQAKFAMSALAILGVVLVLINIYPVEASRTLIFRTKEASLKSHLALMSSALLNLDTITVNSVERVMGAFSSAGLSRILVTDSWGLVLYDSENDMVGQYALGQEIHLALTGHDVVNSHFSLSHIVSKAAVPVVYGDHTIAAIYVQEEDEEQGILAQSLMDNLRTISSIAAAVAAILYVIFSVLFTQRIRDLLTAIQIVGEGEYGHRLEPRGNDEMSLLAEEFNILTDRLQNTEEVRRRFVSDASHELRTPLASIQLLADSILHTEEIPPEMVREFVADICTESQRLSRITERLLNLSKLDSLPAPVAEPVAVGEVIERVLQSLELVAEEAGVELRYRPMEEEVFILCTSDKYHQICYNYVENGVKYTPRGGYVEISTHLREGEVVTEVCDNGLGIPTEDLPKIFNRFYRVDDARSREAGGTGLGLAIVRDTARAYGGWVEARNHSPSGTIFSVGLPCAEEEVDL